MFKTASILIFTLGLFSACQSENKTTALAKGYCQCTAELTALNEKIESGNPSEQDLISLEKAFENAQKCVDSLLKKKGIISAEAYPELYEAIKQTCEKSSYNNDFTRELLRVQ